ncbi:MAG TPA: hypothetical protein P5186_24035, partial [Candidatus Paceibacterota bacterium]|nr:hypothetical protein [Verrucomicrobiota bacterium]HRY51131.1 hypothetical protein [Candidatus Paceibacterota bacterium]
AYPEYREKVNNNEPVTLFTPTGFTATEYFGAMNIQSRQISPCPLALIFVFHLYGQAGRGRHHGMEEEACLNAGLFIGRDHEFILAQGLAAPWALVSIQDPAGFEREF